MITTRLDIVEELKDYLQIGQFSILRTKHVNRDLNDIFSEIYPLFFVPGYYELAIDSPVDESYTIDLPKDIKKLCEIRLEPPGYLYYGSDGVNTALDVPLRLTNYDVTVIQDHYQVMFHTYKWYGTLAIIAECVIEITDDTEKIDVPSTKPLIHHLAAGYHNRMKNRALNAMDTTTSRMHQAEASRELNLARLTLENTKMRRLIVRKNETLNELKNRINIRYSVMTNLPIE